MPAIKITLQRLIELFGKSVNDLGLDMPVRALAARLMTLTAHNIRIESKFDARTKELGDQISQLTEIVQLLAQQQGQPTQASTPSAAPAATPTTTTTPAAVSAPAEAEEEEEEPDEFRRVQAEAAAEVARANAGEADVTPLRKPAGAA